VQYPLPEVFCSVTPLSAPVGTGERRRDEMARLQGSAEAALADWQSTIANPRRSPSETSTLSNQRHSARFSGICERSVGLAWTAAAGLGEIGFFRK
jgi:hypothetical protein